MTSLERNLGSVNKETVNHVLIEVESIVVGLVSIEEGSYRLYI